jgi:2-haloacid dehalogenase
VTFSPPWATRRQLLALTALAACGGPLRGGLPRRIRAIAFDAFVLFSPQEVVRRSRELAGEKGDALFAAASAKLFGYTWYYTSAGKYAEFEELAVDAFKSAAQSLGLTFRSGELERLIDAYADLEIWPDVPAALQALRRSGVRLAMLSNLSERMLRANLRGNRIDENFEFVLSTDQARQYKPSPKAYGLALDAFKLSRRQIEFAASAGWDASGAAWFGYPTVWVNRSGAPAEQAHGTPTITSADMGGVLQLAGAELIL